MLAAGGQFDGDRGRQGNGHQGDAQFGPSRGRREVGGDQPGRARRKPPQGGSAIGAGGSQADKCGHEHCVATEPQRGPSHDHQARGEQQAERRNRDRDGRRGQQTGRPAAPEDDRDRRDQHHDGQAGQPSVDQSGDGPDHRRTMRFQALATAGALGPLTAVRPARRCHLAGRPGATVHRMTGAYRRL